MDVASGLTALGTAVDLTRALRDAAKAGSIRADEFVGRVAEIYDYIIDSKDALFTAQTRISELQSEINEVKSYVFHHSVCWRTLPDGSEDGPFCPVCVGEGPRCAS